MNGTLTFHESRFSGRDTMKWLGHSNPTLYKIICLNFFHSKAKEMQKLHLGVSAPAIIHARIQ